MNTTTEEVRVCAHEPCGQKFIPKRETQLYHSLECKAKAAQARLRKRAKQYTATNPAA